MFICLIWFDSLQVQLEKKCNSNKNCKVWPKPFVGAIEPHTDKGGLLNLRLVFSFAAVTASEGSGDNVSFNPQTMHAGADLAACCAVLPSSVDCKTARLRCRSAVLAFTLSAHCHQAVYDWHCCTIWSWCGSLTSQHSVTFRLSPRSTLGRP